MLLTIIQKETNKTNYLQEVVNFLTGKVKTQEQLQQRFDVLITEFAIAINAVYNAKSKELRII